MWAFTDIVYKSDIFYRFVKPFALLTFLYTNVNTLIDSYG